MRHTRTMRLATAFAALALAVSACGGDSGGEDPTESSGSASGPGGESEAAPDGGGAGEVADSPDDGVTSDAIKVGWMGDVTGATASAQALNLRGIEAYFEYVNGNGGVLGRDFELVVKDDEYGAEAGVANFQALVNDDKVLTINQIGGSHIIDAILSDAERSGIPLVSIAQTVSSSMASDYAFHTLAHYWDMSDVAVARMIEAVGSADELKAAVVQLEVPSGDEWNAGVEKSLAEQGGEYMGRVTINTAQPDAGAFAQEVRALMDEGTNYLAIHVAPAQALFVVNTLADNGLDIPIVGMQGVAALNVYQEGDEDQLAQTEGTHSFTTVADESEGAAEIAEFLAGDGADYAADAEHINFTHGWLGGMIIHQAVERAAADAGEVTRATFHEALKGPIDTKGLTCDIDWSEPPYINPCAAPFTSDGEHMTVVGGFDQWSSTITAEYDG